MKQSRYISMCYSLCVYAVHRVMYCTVCVCGFVFACDMWLCVRYTLYTVHCTAYSVHGTLCVCLIVCGSLGVCIVVCVSLGAYVIVYGQIFLV